MAICIVLAALVLAIQEARRAALRMACSTNLRWIGVALHNYHDLNRAFPPAITYDADGTPLHSWRVLIMPFVVQNALSEAYHHDEAWNGSANRRLTDEVPDNFGGKYGTMLFDAEYFSYRCPGACRHKIACSRTT